MPKCVVKSCSNHSRTALKKDGVSYFNFPKDPILCAEWAAIIGRTRQESFYKPQKRASVCSAHFPESDIYITDKGYRKLAKNAKPTLRLFDDESSDNEFGQQKPVQPDLLSSYFHAYSSVTQSPALHDESSSLQQNFTAVNIKQEIDDSVKILSPQVCLSVAHSPASYDESSSLQHYYSSFSIKQETDDSVKVLNPQEVYIRENEPSPSISSSIGSILDTPKEAALKKTLNFYEIVIQNKNRQIDTLRKQNKRLTVKNSSLKEALHKLKEKKGMDA